MASKSGPDNIIDTFTKFGQDLKLPSMDVQSIIEHHRRNLEALEKSARTASAGAQAIMARQREMLEETLREITDMAQSYRSPGNPQELMSKQTEFARRSFETAVKNSTEMAELVRRSSTETIDVLKERIKAGMEEIREGYEKRK
jgi:phasin family protein